MTGAPGQTGGLGNTGPTGAAGTAPLAADLAVVLPGPSGLPSGPLRGSVRVSVKHGTMVRVARWLPGPGPGPGPQVPGAQWPRAARVARPAPGMSLTAGQHASLTFTTSTLCAVRLELDTGTVTARSARSAAGEGVKRRTSPEAAAAAAAALLGVGRVVECLPVAPGPGLGAVRDGDGTITAGMCPAASGPTWDMVWSAAGCSGDGAAAWGWGCTIGWPIG